MGSIPHSPRGPNQESRRSKCRTAGSGGAITRKRSLAMISLHRYGFSLHGGNRGSTGREATGTHRMRPEGSALGVCPEGVSRTAANPSPSKFPFVD